MKPNCEVTTSQLRPRLSQTFVFSRFFSVFLYLCRVHRPGIRESKHIHGISCDLPTPGPPSRHSQKQAHACEARAISRTDRQVLVGSRPPRKPSPQPPPRSLAWGIEARLHQMLDKCCREWYLKVAPFELQLKTALKTNRRGWGTLVMVPYHIGLLNKLNVCFNGHIYIFWKSREIASWGVVFNEETHGGLRF